MKISALFGGMNDLLGTSGIEDRRYDDNTKARAIAHVVNYQVYPERCDEFLIHTQQEVNDGQADLPEKYLFATLNNPEVKRVTQKEFRTITTPAWTIGKVEGGAFKIFININVSEIFLEYVERFDLEEESESTEFPLMNHFQSAVEYLAVAYMLANDRQDESVWGKIEQEGQRLLRESVKISRQESSGEDSYVLDYAE